MSSIRLIGRKVLPFIWMLALSGCRKESPEARWDVDLLVPLITTTLTIQDLVADSLITTGPGGEITLLYRSELFNVDLDTVLNAPDTSFIYSFALPVPGPLNFAPGANFYGENDLNRFDLDDIELRYLELREGVLELELRNHIQSGVIGTFSLPGATLSTGPALLTTFVSAGTQSVPALASVQTSLSGARFDLRGPDLNDVNTLATDISAQLDPNGSGATLTDQDSLIAHANYRGLVPQYARGYFGNRVVEVEESENNLDLFNNVVGGTLDLDQVTMRLKVINGFGMDIQVLLDHLTAINSRTGNSVDLSNALFEGPLNLGRAIDQGNGSQPTEFLRVLDNSNSNLDLFLENLPDKVSYAMELRLNPLGDISNGNDFLYYESELKADLELEIPLRIIAQDLTLRTTVVPDLPGSAEGHGLRSGQLRVFATNGFPFSAGLVLGIVNDSDELVSSIPVEGQVASGVLGTNGLVQLATDSRLTATLSEQQVEQLYAGGRIRIDAVFNTSDPFQHVQLLDSYRLDLQVTLGANYIVNGDE